MLQQRSLKSTRECVVSVWYVYTDMKANGHEIVWEEINSPINFFFGQNAVLCSRIKSTFKIQLSLLRTKRLLRLLIM